MQILRGSIIYVLFIIGAINPTYSKAAKADDMHQLWLDCKLDGKVSYQIFNLAMQGYHLMDNLKKKNLLTIIDYSKPSNEKRFLVIDLVHKKLLYHCLVAHGKNTGENSATNFSNQSNSLKSCLGFFITAETYSGENGYSLRLDGLEKDINSNARARDIVIHGADYVSEQFIKNYGRLGRSWGCPALPIKVSKQIIDTISGGSCLFIYGNGYRENSKLLNN
ncbi:MAG: murein L,D-transpeptidase catalytic domain family protein [Salinivirgaceae bacterium]